MPDNKIYSTKNGRLYFDGQDLTELVHRYGTPVYVFSERKLKNNVREIQEKFREYHARTSIHYAANNESAIANLQIIRNAGSNLEVNSVRGLFKGLYSDFKGDQIIFNGVSRFEDEIEIALVNNLKSINVDSECELERIAAIAKRLNKRANITIRIMPESLRGAVKEKETGAHGSGSGIDADAVESAVRRALENRSQICLKGYCFRIDAQIYDLKSFVDAFKLMLNLAVDIYRKAGYRPELLNIGGCLPIPYYIDHAAMRNMPGNISAMLENGPPVERIAKELCTELNEEKVREWAGKENARFFRDVELILEPGRKVTASAGVLLSRIEKKKERKELDENWLMIDAGFHTAGACGTPNISNYNGRPKAGIVLIRENGQVIMIKPAKKYSDLSERG